MALPSIPPQYKNVSHYFKTGNEHQKRDPVVSYYCKLYAFQKCLEIDKKAPECRSFLASLMDILEKEKKSSPDEAIHNEVVGNAHLENYALKVFAFADTEDRQSRFTKSVVKSFYTAGLLFDVLSTFGELNEDLDQKRKYAKLKAVYINKCLKEGTQPVPGPFEEDSEEGATGGSDLPSTSYPNPSTSYPPPPAQNTNYLQHPTPGVHAPPTTPAEQPVSGAHSTWTPPAASGNVELTSDQYSTAMKYCKFASSALQYQDTPTAVTNLQKALTLLTTGKDS